MNTRLQAYAAGAVEAAVLLAAVAVPVFVNFYGFRVFDLGKGAVLLSLAAAAAAFGVIAAVEGGAETARGFARSLRRPLVAGAALTWLATAIATATSLNPRLSFFGAPERSAGLLILTATLVLFAATAWLARRPERRRRIVALLVAGSVPVSLFAVAQALGIEVVPGEVESEMRAFGTLANPIFLGAYLMLLAPLTVTRIGAAARANRPGLFAAYAAIALVQVAALILTASRGPLLGLAAGLVVLAVAAAATGGPRRLGWGAVALVVAGALGLAVFNLPNSPLAPLRDVPVVGRFGRLSDTSSGSEAARVRIWRSVGRLLAAEPERLVTGHGPETLKYALIPHAETYVAGRGQAGRLVDRAHNVLLDALVMTGIVGAAALLLTYGAWLWTAAVAAGLARSPADRRLLAACLAGGTVLGASSWLVRPFYGGAVTLLGLVAGLGIYLVLALATRRSDGFAPEPGDAGEAGAGVGAAGRRSLALALLAAGAAAVVEAAFGIQTVVTQAVAWILAGLAVALAAGDAAMPVAVRASGAARSSVPPARGRAARSEADAPARGTVTLTWSPAGNALGLVAGTAAGLLFYNFIVFGTPPLPDTWPTVILLVAGAVLAGLVAAGDVGESRLAFALGAAVALTAYLVVRGVTLAAAQDASWLYAATVVWLVGLVPFVGLWLRGETAPGAPAWSGPVGLAYPLVALPVLGLVWFAAVLPVRADIYFQTAVATFDAAVASDDAALVATAEELYRRATQLNPREDTYPLTWGERYMAVGARSADVTAAAQAFQRAQTLVQQAEALDPLMPYHTFNRGHLQLVFAQKLEAGSQQSLDAAANAAVALQSVFDQAPYDPQVANELALAKLVAGDSQGAVNLLEFVRKDLDPRNGQTYRLLGQAYYAAGDAARAKAALEQALALGETMSAADRGSLQLMVAEIAREEGDLAAAIQHYEAVLATGQGDWRVLYNLGLVYRDQGNFEKALAALSQVLQVAPDEARPQVQSALDNVLARTGGGGVAP